MLSPDIFCYIGAHVTAPWPLGIIGFPTMFQSPLFTALHVRVSLLLLTQLKEMHRLHAANVQRRHQPCDLRLTFNEAGGERAVGLGLCALAVIELCGADWIYRCGAQRSWRAARALILSFSSSFWPISSSDLESASFCACRAAACFSAAAWASSSF